MVQRLVIDFQHFGSPYMIPGKIITLGVIKDPLKASIEHLVEKQNRLLSIAMHKTPIQFLLETNRADQWFLLLCLASSRRSADDLLRPICH